MVQMFRMVSAEAALASAPERSSACASRPNSSGKKFQRDKAFQASVFRFVNDTPYRRRPAVDDAVVQIVSLMHEWRSW